MLKSWCFSNRKKGKTIVERCFFVNGNCEELLDCSVLAMGRRKKVADSGVLVMGKWQKVVDNGVSTMGKMVFQQWGKWCFNNGENGERLLTVVFQQWGKW
jgi:hypothetical protein